MVCVALARHCLFHFIPSSPSKLLIDSINLSNIPAVELLSIVNLILEWLIERVICLEGDFGTCSPKRLDIPSRLKESPLGFLSWLEELPLEPPSWLNLSVRLVEREDIPNSGRELGNGVDIGKGVGKEKGVDIGRDVDVGNGVEIGKGVKVVCWDGRSSLRVSTEKILLEGEEGYDDLSGVIGE